MWKRCPCLQEPGVSSAWILPDPSLCRDTRASPPVLGSVEAELLQSAQLTQINQSHSILSISMNPRAGVRVFPGVMDTNRWLKPRSWLGASLCQTGCWARLQLPLHSGSCGKRKQTASYSSQEEWAGPVHALNPFIK